jgi:hypothetical protein
MIFNLPEFDFEVPHPNAVVIEPLLHKVRQFLDTRGVDRNEYALVSQLAV